MCQLNLIFVKNSINKEILKNNEYEYFGENFKTFFSYVKGFCNCGSFVGSMSEYAGDSYIEMVNELNSSELKRLNKIKTFMNKPNYKNLKGKYIADKEKLANNLEEFINPLFNYEMEQLNLLQTKYNGQSLEYQKELLYKNLDKKLQKIESSSEYKYAEAKFNEFIEKNKLMDESILYYLTKEDEENDEKNNNLFMELDDTIETFDMPKESLVIDTVIRNLQTRYENDYNVFLEYKQLFEKLLENEDCILFCCIWDNPKKMSIKKEVNIDNLRIEDLASLKYNQILRICNSTS